MYAMYRFLMSEDNEVVSLVNMCNGEGKKSSSHGLDKYLLAKQAEAISIPLLQPLIENNSYEYSFKKAINGLIEKYGINSGVFGDIHLEAHRQWIERVCSDMGIQAVFPLWGMKTDDIIRDFVNVGFRTIVVSVRKGLLSKEFLGRLIDDSFIEDVGSYRDVDICGENGEYHTYVFDGPVFKKEVFFDVIGEYDDCKHWFLDIK